MCIQCPQVVDGEADALHEIVGVSGDCGQRIDARTCLGRRRSGWPDTGCQAHGQDTGARDTQEKSLLAQERPRPPCRTGACSRRGPRPRNARGADAAFQLDEFGREVPDVRAEAAIIYNPETGEVLWEDHAQDQRSIASITKVMTAIVFLEDGAPTSARRSRFSAATCHAPSTTYLRAGYKVTADDLLHLLLDRLRQRRGPRAGAHLAVRLRRLHRPDEREGRRARPREHALRGSVRPAVRQRLVGLRHGAADRLCLGRRAHRRRSCARPSYTVHDRQAATITRQQHQSAGPQRRRRRASAARPASSAAPATAWRRCCACRSAASRWRWSCSAPVERRPLLGNAAPVQLAVGNRPSDAARTATPSRASSKFSDAAALQSSYGRSA